MASSGFLDYSQVAALYSQLAGVLAGFAFAGLIAVATIRLSGGKYDAHVSSAYQPLMCSFFSLVSASVNYAIVSGERERTGRAAAAEASAGVGFCAAGCVLVFSILVTLDSVERGRPESTDSARRAVDLVRRILTLFVPPLFVLLFLPAVRDHSAVKYKSADASTFLDHLAIIVVVASVVSSVVLAVVYRRLSGHRTTRDLLSVPGLVVAILATIATNFVIGFLHPDLTTPDAVPVIELLLVAGLGFVTSLAAARFEAAPASAEPERAAVRVQGAE